ncbi:MAG TPA: glyoxylate/hydroxypyruvate reductase A [Candidatus Binatia bacterium]|nr:glyoxylate/hydroxypyruvate reductase A [Candidatus Binatia bacterium]
MTGERILFAVAEADVAAWERAFRKVGLTLTEEGGAGIRFCLVWHPPAETYARLPDLQVIFSLGAGVERLLGDPAVPPHAAIVKMAEPGMTETMVQHVLWQVIGHHRRFWELAEAQREARWLDQLYPPPWQRKVGVLGLGTLGSAAARALRDFSFDVRGWSRSAKTIDGVACFAGTSGLDAFLDGLEIVVCLLPLTPETAGILNADLFRRLARGAALVNVARGGHLNEADLLEALADGRLAAASLDVTGTEPLPEGHPFWRHPRIFMTPHNAADIDPETAAVTIARQIARHAAGQPLERAVDRARGY